MFLHKSSGTASWRLMIIVTCCCCCYLLLGNSLLSLSHRRPRRLRMRPSRQQTQGTGSDDHRSQRSVARVWSHWEPQCQCFLIITIHLEATCFLLNCFKFKAKCSHAWKYCHSSIYLRIVYCISLASLVFDNVEQSQVCMSTKKTIKIQDMICFNFKSGGIFSVTMSWQVAIRGLISGSISASGAVDNAMLSSNHPLHCHFVDKSSLLFLVKWSRKCQLQFCNFQLIKLLLTLQTMTQRCQRTRSKWW